jgi:hypothetical protein
MSLWLRTFLTKPLDVTLDQLSHALDDADFYMMAEWQELDDELGPLARKSLRFEHVKHRDKKRWIVLVHYRHHELGDRFMHFELWRDPKKVKEEVSETLENDPPAKAKKLLPQVVETAAFELKVSDAEGMGWPIAYHLAMWLAQPERGNGLVEYEDDWWDAKTYKKL